MNDDDDQLLQWVLAMEARENPPELTDTTDYTEQENDQ